MFLRIKEFNTSFYTGCVRFVIKTDMSGVRGLFHSGDRQFSIHYLMVTLLV